MRNYKGVTTREHNDVPTFNRTDRIVRRHNSCLTRAGFQRGRPIRNHDEPGCSEWGFWPVTNQFVA